MPLDPMPATTEPLPEEIVADLALKWAEANATRPAV